MNSIAVDSCSQDVLYGDRLPGPSTTAQKEMTPLYSTSAKRFTAPDVVGVVGVVGLQPFGRPVRRNKSQTSHHSAAVFLQGRVSLRTEGQTIRACRVNAEQKGPRGETYEAEGSDEVLVCQGDRRRARLVSTTRVSSSAFDMDDTGRAQGKSQRERPDTPSSSGRRA